MKVIICGVDGYLGWPLALNLLGRGHTVIGVDNLSRRRRVREVGSHSATNIESPFVRFMALHEEWPEFQWRIMDLTGFEETDYVISKHKPDTIIHLGEIPSAPYSMLSNKHAVETYNNNVSGTLNLLFAMKKHAPDAHLIKLGTMGEYGTPDMDIPEAAVSEFPRAPGSYYHSSKVADSINVEFACKIWGLRSTDIHQGVVHGITTPDMYLQAGCLFKDVDSRLITRFDFDEIWGTALNRFCAQAIVGHDLTPYGKGGQTRGYIALRDSMQCLSLVTENPPKEGEYRTLNQYDETYSVNELAEHVVDVADEFGIEANIWDERHMQRVESEDHYYNPTSVKLREMGFKPTFSLDDELRITIPFLQRYKDRIEEKKTFIYPTPDLWRKGRT